VNETFIVLASLIGTLAGVVSVVVVYLLYRRERKQLEDYQHLQERELQQYRRQVRDPLSSKEHSPEAEAESGRAETLRLLHKLDPKLKRELVRDLYEANLIKKQARPSVNLMAKADLEGTDLSRLTLDHVDLSAALLENARLQGTRLRNANLQGAEMAKADLSGADLSAANLTYANLTSADLSDANLIGADLSNASLIDAEVNSDQLNEARSLEHAIMPNGQTYEDWLKSRGEENSGP
jgi:hypothetical protein